MSRKHPGQFDILTSIDSADLGLVWDASALETKTISKANWQSELAGTGSSNITTLGTIATGVWNGTDIPLSAGGTGASLSDPGADRIPFWDDSAGAVTWLTAGSGLTISGTTITASGVVGGSDTQVQFNNSGAFDGDAGMTWDGDTLTLTKASGILGPLIIAYDGSNSARLASTSSGQLYCNSDIVLQDLKQLILQDGASADVGFKPPITMTTPTVWTLPVADGAAGQLLKTDGSANLSWVTSAGGGNVSASGSPVNNDFAKFVNGTDIEGRSYSEVRTDLGLVIGTNVLAEQTIGIADNNLLEVDDADMADNDFLRATASGVEGRSYAEVLVSLSGEAGDSFDFNSQDLEGIDSLFMIERASANLDVSGSGQVWVKSNTPNELWFTDDAGTDKRLDSSDGWQEVGENWAYASATTFTIAGDKTGKYQKGDKIKLTQTTVKYFYILGVSESGGTTTVTVTGGSDYTIANASITNPFFSRVSAPFGFPNSFNWTPTITGFSADPTSSTYKFSIDNGICFIEIQQGTSGTSNSALFHITAPVPSAVDNTTVGLWFFAYDGGAKATNPGGVTIMADTPDDYMRVNISIDTNDGWATSGAKRVRLAIQYLI